MQPVLGMFKIPTPAYYLRGYARGMLVQTDVSSGADYLCTLCILVVRLRLGVRVRSCFVSALLSESFARCFSRATIQRSSFPMGDLLCIVKGTNKATPIGMPDHLKKTVKIFIKQGDFFFSFFRECVRMAAFHSLNACSAVLRRDVLFSDRSQTQGQARRRSRG